MQTESFLGIGHGGPKIPDVGKIVRQIEHAGSGALEQIEHKTQGAVQQVEGKIKDGEQRVQHAAEGGVKQIEHAIGNLPKQIEHLVAQALIEIFSPAEKEAFHKAAMLARFVVTHIHPDDKASEDINNLVFGFTLKASVGAISPQWINVLERGASLANELDQLGDHGIGNSRHEIISAMKSIGPHHYDLAFDLTLYLGTAVGVSPFVWGCPAKTFYALADRALREAGVPA